MRDQEPSSLTDLARLVTRDYKGVHQDVAILVEGGLIEIRKLKGAKTRALKPVSVADPVEFKIT